MRGAGNGRRPWPGCSLWVDSPQESASHCPCLAPTPPHGRLGQATVSRPFIFKIPAVFPPQPKEQCQPQIRLRPGLGAQRRRGWGFRPPHSCRCNSGRAMRPGQPASQPHWVRRPRHAPDTGPKVLGVSPGARWRSSQRYTLHPVAWASQVAQW